MRIPYSTFIDMVGEENLPRTFIEKIKAIEVDEFSYFQVHLALKAPVRYALFEAEDAAVGQAMNVNMGPEKRCRSGCDVAGDPRR